MTSGEMIFGLLILLCLIGYSCNLWLPWLTKKFKKKDEDNNPE